MNRIMTQITSIKNRLLSMRHQSDSSNFRTLTASQIAQWMQKENPSKTLSPTSIALYQKWGASFPETVSSLRVGPLTRGVGKVEALAGIGQRCGLTKLAMENSQKSKVKLSPIARASMLSEESKQLLAFMLMILMLLTLTVVLSKSFNI
jgi:hypothetical protein